MFCPYLFCGEDSGEVVKGAILAVPGIKTNFLAHLLGGVKGVLGGGGDRPWSHRGFSSHRK